VAYSVVLCDDNKNIRAFLRFVLSEQHNIDFVAEGENGSDAVRLCRELSPALLLIDIEMATKTDGIDAIEEIRTFNSEIKIIVITVYDNDDFVIDAFARGADNFLLKDQTPDEILAIIDSTINGQSNISQIVAQKLKNYIARNVHKKNTNETNYIESVRILSLLTNTELDILILLRQGLTRKEISDIKMVELGTIKTHITNLLKKFENNRSSDLIKYLENMGFFDFLDTIRR